MHENSIVLYLTWRQDEWWNIYEHLIGIGEWVCRHRKNNNLQMWIMRQHLLLLRATLLVEGEGQKVILYPQHDATIPGLKSDATVNICLLWAYFYSMRCSYSLILSFYENEWDVPFNLMITFIITLNGLLLYCKISPKWSRESKVFLREEQN